MKEIYTGNFDDVGAAKVATLSLINAGCDFIFHQANEAGRGVFQACQERKVRCFGSNKNQNDMAPDVIVASAVLDVPAAFAYMARLVHDHKFSRTSTARPERRDRLAGLERQAEGDAQARTPWPRSSERRRTSAAER